MAVKIPKKNWNGHTFFQMTLFSPKASSSDNDAILGVACSTAKTKPRCVTLPMRPTKRPRRCWCAGVCSEHRRARGGKIKFQNREGWENDRQGRRLGLERLRRPWGNVTVDAMAKKTESGFAAKWSINRSQLWEEPQFSLIWIISCWSQEQEPGRHVFMEFNQIQYDFRVS